MAEKTVLVVAAHPDDEVLGCGGTLALYSKRGYAVHVLLLADGEGARIPNDQKHIINHLLEKRNDSAQKACKVLGCRSVETIGMPDNRLDTLSLLDVIREVEIRIQRYSPRIVLTHHSSDINVDHQITHKAVITACRPVPNHCVKELLFFETPSSTEWCVSGSQSNFIPNYFIDISDTFQLKLAALAAYADEMREFPHPRSMEAIEGLARWRGASVGVAKAEAFNLGRMIMDSI